MVKKRFVFLFLVSLVLLSFIVLAQDTVSDIMKGDLKDTDFENPLNLPKDGEEVKEKASEKWDYLSDQWRNLLMENKVIKLFDKMMGKMDGVLTYFIGVPYNFGFGYFVLLFLWLIFGIRFGEFISRYMGFEGWARVGVWIGSGVAFSVILSYLGIYKFIIGIPSSSYFSDVVWWVGILLWVFVIAIIILLYYFSGMLGKFSKAYKESNAKGKEKHEREELHSLVKEIKTA